MAAVRRLNWLDGVLLAVLMLGVVAYASRYVVRGQHPYEDAAILMRYAQHLADGQGLVWNVGEKPVDGATDFLLVCAQAALHKAGVPLETAARAIAGVSHLLTVLLIYLTIAVVQGRTRWLAFTSAAYLGIGPGVALTAAYFGTPLFALVVALSWLLASQLLAGPATRTLNWGFAVCCLVMTLIRPEGVFLALFMLAVVLWRRGVRASGDVVLPFVLIFACLGGAYLAWRWHCFGYPLPNPYYKKGGGLHPESLRPSIENALTLAAPFLGAYVAIWARDRQSVLRAAPALLVAGAFTVLWVLLSNEMNYAARFQYPVLAIVLMSWATLFPRANESPEPARGRIAGDVLVGLPLLLALLLYAHWNFSDLTVYGRDGRYDVACMLRQYKDRGYTMAVSEAGLLPFYSQWRAVDTWGLNNQWIAHHGGQITEEYLDRYKPELIMFLGTPQGLPGPAPTAFMRMGGTLKGYAVKRGYSLAAAYGPTPVTLHYYYVKPGFADAAPIIGAIRAIDYRWMRSAGPCVNYAAAAR